MLTTAFARVGLAGDYGGTWFLTRLVGSGKARELYYFSNRLRAANAERLGIVNAVFPEADFQQEVMARADRLAAGPSVAYRYMTLNVAVFLLITIAGAIAFATMMESKFDTRRRRATTSTTPSGSISGCWRWR